MSQELLSLPADEIGWSDESFDLALRFVMRTATLSEIRDMQSWLMDNVSKDIFWAFARQVAYSGIFKRTILLAFRNFEPSAMQNAYNYVKQHPRKNLRKSNALAILRLVVLSICAMLLIALAFYLVISNMFR